jgi:hypothetical protein
VLYSPWSDNRNNSPHEDYAYKLCTPPLRHFHQHLAMLECCNPDNSICWRYTVKT